MNDEEFVKEMENYSDLFIDEVVRVGRRSMFPDPDSINIGLSVLCVEDDDNCKTYCNCKVRYYRI